MPVLSYIIPCYNEEESLPFFVDELVNVTNQLSENHADYSFEAVFIDDGSTDATLDFVQNLAEQELPFRVEWTSFSRNFGKESALYAGLKKATGDFVVVMDADMQDPPSLIPQMIDLITTGNFDCVATRRKNRKGEPPVRSFFSALFYRVINRLSDTIIEEGARDFRLMTRSMVNAVLEVSEYNRFSKGIFSWVGFNTAWIEYENEQRAAGESKWSFGSLLSYGLNGIVSFTEAPLAAVGIFGGVVSLIAVIFLCVIVVRAFLVGDPVAGWPSMMSVILLIGGIQMLFLGIIGEYLAKAYLETKRRPLYIVKDESKAPSSEKTE